MDKGDPVLFSNLTGIEVLNAVCVQYCCNQWECRTDIVTVCNIFNSGIFSCNNCNLSTWILYHICFDVNKK